MQVQVEVEQRPFDLEPTLVAYFNPTDEVSRGETAFVVTQLHQL
jgi:serine protease AprX